MSYDVSKYVDGINSDIEQLFRGYPFETATIKKCAKQYAINGSYSFYRITEFFRSIFNCSDWQEARKEAVELLKTKYIRIFSPQRVDQKINIEAMKSEKEWQFLADELINVFVKQYEFCGKFSGQPTFKFSYGDKSKELIVGALANFYTAFKCHAFVAV